MQNEAQKLRKDVFELIFVANAVVNKLEVVSKVRTRAHLYANLSQNAVVKELEMLCQKPIFVAKMQSYSLYGRGMAHAFLLLLRDQRPYPPRIPTFGPARFFALEA